MRLQISAPAIVYTIYICIQTGDRGFHGEPKARRPRALKQLKLADYHCKLGLGPGAGHV